MKFLKVDVDKVQEVARRYRVTAMPTFKFVKGGKEVAEVSLRHCCKRADVDRSEEPTPRLSPL